MVNFFGQEGGWQTTGVDDFTFSHSLFFFSSPSFASLKGNQVGDEGAQALGDALKVNKTMTFLK